MEIVELSMISDELMDTWALAPICNELALGESVGEIDGFLDSLRLGVKDSVTVGVTVATIVACGVGMVEGKELSTPDGMGDGG
jgi:hypothetical protein